MIASVDIEGLLDEVKSFDIQDAAPVAFFDADYTLWGIDLADACIKLCMKERLLKTEAATVLAPYIEKAGATPTGDPHDDSELIYQLYLDDKVSEYDIVAAQVVCYAGLTPDEASDLGTRVFDETVGAHVYDGIERLHEALRARGLHIKVISGSAQWLVEGAVKRLGVPAEDVISAFALVDPETDKITGTMGTPYTYHQGKVEAMELVIGDKRAAVAFGDSMSDVYMLGRSVLRVGVNARPALKAHAAENEPDRWRMWLPAKMRSGESVVALETDRIVV